MKKLSIMILTLVVTLALPVFAQVIQVPSGFGIGPGFAPMQQDPGFYNWETSGGEFRSGLIREFLPENVTRMGASQAVLIPNSASTIPEFLGGGIGYSPAQTVYIASGGLYCNAALTSPIYNKQISNVTKTFALSFQVPNYVWNLEYSLAENATYTSNTLFAYFYNPTNYLMLYWANSLVSQFKSGNYGFTPGQKHTVLVSYDPANKEFLMVTDRGVSASGTYTGLNYDKTLADFDRIMLGYNVGNPSYLHGVWNWNKTFTVKQAKSAVRAIQNRAIWSPATYVAPDPITTSDSLFRTGLECEYTPASYSSYASGAYEFINMVYDTSGNGHHATQTIETSMPTATTSAIFFDDTNASLICPAMARCKTFAIRLQFTQANTDNGIFKYVSNGLITYPTNAFYEYFATVGSPADLTYHQIYAGSALNGRDVVLLGTLDETNQVNYMMIDNYAVPRFYGSNTINFAPKSFGYTPATYIGFVGKFKGFWGWTKTFTMDELKLLEGAISAL